MTSNLVDFNSFSGQNENTCSYYTIQEFLSLFNKGNSDIYNRNTNNNMNNDTNDENFSILHINSRSICKNFDSLLTLIHSLKNFSFSVIGISETWLNKNSPDVFNICDYEMIHVDRENIRGGGVALYVHKTLKYKIRNDILFPGIENIFVEIENKAGKNILIGALYRPPSNVLNEFIDNLDEVLDRISKESKDCYLMGDYNIDLSLCLQYMNSASGNQNINSVNNIYENPSSHITNNHQYKINS